MKNLLGVVVFFAVLMPFGVSAFQAPDMSGRVEEFVNACANRTGVIWADPNPQNQRRVCRCSAMSILYDGHFSRTQQALIFYITFHDAEGVKEMKRYLQDSKEELAYDAIYRSYGSSCMNTPSGPN